MKFEAEVTWDNGMTFSKEVRVLAATTYAMAFAEVENIERTPSYQVNWLKRVIPIPIPRKAE